MAKEKVFKSSFEGFDYSVSVPSADFEGKSARDIRDRIQEHLFKWYNACYKELTAKFQHEFKIDVSNGKEATIHAKYENGYASLDGSILQQTSAPVDDSKRIKFPLPSTEKFETIDKYVVSGVVFSKHIRGYFAREIRDGWIKEVKELPPKEMEEFWNANLRIVHVRMRDVNDYFINGEPTNIQNYHNNGGKSIVQHLQDEFGAIVRVNLTEEGRAKYNTSGFCRGPSVGNIQKWVVEKQLPIEINGKEHNTGIWDSYLRRGLLEITEKLSFKNLVDRNLLNIKQRGAYELESQPHRYWNSLAGLTSIKEEFALLRLTAKGKEKYDEAIIKLLNKEETDRIEKKAF